MLIQALCDYYDILKEEGKVVEDGYSQQGIHYLIALSDDGKIDSITNWQIKEKIVASNGKIKEKEKPRMIKMPLRSEKTTVFSNIVEHRPTYLFGLNYEEEKFTPDDKTQYAKKSHDAFVKQNLEFIEGIDSPVVNAYRNFILNWCPQKEIENPFLVSIGKAYKNAYFAFCLSGHMDVLLHEDNLIKSKWNTYNASNISEEKHIAQCAITGESLPIARIHNRIKGINEGLSSGTVLVGYKEKAGCSYCNEYSYNSNISLKVMKKYTLALNALLSDAMHKKNIDDITIIYWAIGEKKHDEYVDLFSSLLFEDNNKLDEKHTEKFINDLFNGVQEANISRNKIVAMDDIDDNVDFYIVGIKPNTSRISLKFIHHRKFVDIVCCVADHQRDMWIFDASIGKKINTIPLWQIKNELKSPKSKNDKVDPSLLSEIFKSVLYGKNYPKYLLSKIVKRVKTDKYINRTRAGVIKACINRKQRCLGKEEEITVALNKNNDNQAYLCGRLFAVLEKIQKNATLKNLNRTIKDAYFASAASKPALVFPKLLKLSNNHLKKLDEKNNVYFDKLIEEIVEKLNGEFPNMLMLAEQGKFMIGYYQQEQEFYKKSENNKEEQKND